MQYQNSFTFLGSSAGVPQANRSTTSHVLKIGDSLNIIDCGGSFCQNFLRKGFDPLEIDRVFITHSHPDHVTELPLLIQMIKLLKRGRPVEFFLPEEFAGPFLEYLPAMYLFRDRFPFEMRVVSIGDNPVADGSFRLQAQRNNHLEKNVSVARERGYPNLGQSFSLDITVGTKTLFHSADIGSYDDVKEQIDHHDYVTMESAHIDVGSSFNHARLLDVGTFVITHIVSDEEADSIWEEAKARGIANLVLATDGLELEL